MKIRNANYDDIKNILEFDKHISLDECKNVILLNRGYVIEEKESIIGWLRYNLFWDSIPFMNMLYIKEKYRKQGYGKILVYYWEQQMKINGHNILMTSTLSNETSQHFYRKLGYFDIGSFIISGEKLELIFQKQI